MPPWLREHRRWHWERNRCLVFLLLYLGLRLSEAAGLTWADIKLEANLITISMVRHRATFAL
jgi:integrase